MNSEIFMEAMGDIKDEFIMEAADIENLKDAFSDLDDEEEETITEPKKIKRIPRIHKLLLAAVISVSLLLAANLVAMAMGYNTLAFPKGFGDRLVEMFVGERTEYKGITIYKGGDLISFKNIEEFFEKTDYDILYPSKLPDGLEITQVDLYDSHNEDLSLSTEYKEICYILPEPRKYGISVDTNPNTNFSFLTDKNAHIETVNDYKCYIYYNYYNDNATVQCHFLYNNYVYTVLAPTYDDIVTIVSNMKEYEE